MSVKVTTQRVLGKKSLTPNRAFYDMYCRLYLKSLVNDNAEVLRQIEYCGAHLSNIINSYRNDTSRNLLLYPLHIFSDELAIIVALKAINNKLYVISDVSDSDWERKWGRQANSWKLKNKDLTLYNPFIKSKQDATKGIRGIIKSVRVGNANFAIFPDAMPEYTRRFGVGHSYTKVKLFDRQAMLHAGPFNFPKLMRSDVLPYYIYIKNGKLCIKTLDPIAYEDVEVKLTSAIQTGLDKVYKQWTLWHFPSFFFRNG